MLFNRLGQITKKQQGFTLIEVLIAIAISSIIGIAVTTSIFQVFDVNARNNNNMTAINEMENAVYSITPDAQMAQNITATASSGFPLTLTWVEWNGDSYDVTYDIQNGQFQRSYSINGGTPNTTIVAQHIDSAQTSCNFTNGTLAFKITAAVSGYRPASQTRSFTIALRSAQ